MNDDFPETEEAGVPIEETDRLIASDKVEGTPVYDAAGERLGHILNFMVDKIDGRVEYAILSLGGFLGIGEHYHPIPWKMLEYDPDMGGYVVDLDKEKLMAAPRYAPGQEPAYDADYQMGIYGYYGVPWGVPPF